MHKYARTKVFQDCIAKFWLALADVKQEAQLWLTCRQNACACRIPNVVFPTLRPTGRDLLVGFCDLQSFTRGQLLVIFSNIYIVHKHSPIWRSQWEDPLELSGSYLVWKSRMAGLQSGGGRMMIDSVVWAQYNQRDRHTVTQPRHRSNSCQCVRAALEWLLNEAIRY